MDKWLAEIYQNDVASSSLEKTAQSVMLQKLAEEEGVDLSGLDEEQLEALAQEVLTAEDAEEIEEETIEDDTLVDEEELSKEAQAKFDEADFLGRVMAHSFYNEAREIEKTASFADVMRAGKTHARNAVGKAKTIGGKIKDIATAKEFRSGLKANRGATKMEAAAQKAKDPAKLERARHGKSLARKAMIRGGAKTVGGAVGVGAAAYGSKKALNKEASAFDTLAEQRAMEILSERGFDQGVEKQADPTEAFNQALESRALEMLAEAGYDVE